MEQLCFPLFLSLSSEIEVDVLLENYEIAAQNVVYIHSFPQLQLVAWKNFEREVNTLIKAFLPPISKIGWDISQKLQVLGDLHLLLTVWLCDNYVKHLIAQSQQQKQRKLRNIFKVNNKDIRIKHVLNLGLVFLLLNLNR